MNNTYWICYTFFKIFELTLMIYFSYELFVFKVEGNLRKKKINLNELKDAILFIYNTTEYLFSHFL